MWGKKEDLDTVIWLEREVEECVVGYIAEEVGQGMKAHLNVNRNDPVEGMRVRGWPKEQILWKGK